MLNKFFYMASRATYQNILSGGDIFSSKSKMYYRHRKYILYKFMYNLFFGISVVYVWKMKYFLKINRSEKIKIITKYFWCLSYRTSITDALLQPIKLSRFLQGNTNTGMVTTHSSFMNGHIWRPFSMKLFVNLSPS